MNLINLVKTIGGLYAFYMLATGFLGRGSGGSW